MKSTFTIRTTSLLMAFLLIISTTGFTMNMHFCMGEFQDIAFFGSDVDCSMMEEQIKPACPMHAIKSMDCCEDQDVEIEASSHETLLLKHVKVTADWSFEPTPEFILATPSFDEVRESYTTYRPPPADREIFLLVQSFLL